MKLRLTLIVVFSVAVICQPLKAQSYSCASKKETPNWINKPFEHFVFVENVGQLKNENESWGNKTKYSAKVGGVDIYFSPQGLIYKYEKFNYKDEKEIEKKGEHKEDDLEKQRKHETFYLQVNWIGASNSATIKASEIQAGYYSFPNEMSDGNTGMENVQARCYKKITYTNLYPNIDVEYILPEKGGLKYTLILHPGADISLVKMNYSNAGKLKIDNDGNIIIKSDFGEFIDHAPVSYSNSNKVVPSSFTVSNNDVSFNVGDYNKSEVLIIDPWIRVPNNTNPRYVPHDVDYDLNGNVYVHGAESVAIIFGVTQLGGPLILEKYNSAGVWQWTFSGVTAGYYGDFSVDKASGTSYIVQGNGPTMVRKINTNGQQVASCMQFSSMDEYWRCEFDNCSQKLVIAGGGSFTSAQAATIDVSLTNYSSFPVLANQTRYQDILFLALDPGSPFCYMATPRNGTQPPSFHDQMIKCSTPSLFPPLAWGPVSTNYTVYSEGTIPGGINGMVCGKNFLYTFQGGILKKWNKITGTFIAQTNVAGGSYGLTVDECDNVYAGVNGSPSSVKAFNSSLIQIATYPIALTGQIADIKIGPGDKLYASGIGFVSEIQLPKSFTMTSTNPSSCNSCNGSATVLSCSAPSNYSYLWSAGGQTTQTATGLCPGKYTVTVTINCSPIYTDSVTIGGGSFTLNTSQANVTCISSFGNASVTPVGGASPYVYNWSNGSTTNSISGLGVGTYMITVTDANNCKIVKAFNISKPFPVLITIASQGSCAANSATSTVTATNGTAPYIYLWSNGQTTKTATGLNNNSLYSITVTDFNGCTASSTVKVSVVPIQFSSSNITCASFGSATATPSQSAIPYTYSWSNGQSGISLVGNTISVFVAGIYSVTVTDGNGCTVSHTFNITSSTPVSASFTHPSPICVGSTVNFTNTGTAGPGVTHTWWLAVPPSTYLTGTTVDFSYTFLTTGTYSITHNIQDANGCRASIIESSTVVNCTGPIVTTTGSSVCQGSCATVTTSGIGGVSPYTYSWSNGATSQNISPCPALTTTYTVTIKDTGGNTSTSTAVVVVNPAVTVTTTPTNITCNGNTNGSANANPGGGTSPYTYSWSNGQTTQTVTTLPQGNYTVKVTDAKGCTATSSVAILSPPALSGQFAKGTAGCASCGCKEWIMVTGLGGTSPYTYTWPDGYVNRYKNQLCPTVYTINIIDKNGCSTNLIISAP